MSDNTTPVNYNSVEQINATIAELMKNFGHDAGAKAAIEALDTYLISNLSVITMEKEIVEKTNAKFSFEFMARDTVTKPSNPKDFMELFNRASLMVAYAFQLARWADLDPSQMAYLEAKIVDRTRENLSNDELLAVGMEVPSKEEVARNAERVFKPMVEMVERINNAMVSKPIFAKARAQELLAIRKKSHAQNLMTIAQFDEATEKVLDIEVAEDLALERIRLDAFRKTGEVDKAVVVSPLFQFYEDQLIYNIQMLEHRQETGSPARQAFVRATNENELLEVEIEELEKLIDSEAVDEAK